MLRAYIINSMLHPLNPKPLNPKPLNPKPLNPTSLNINSISHPEPKSKEDLLNKYQQFLSVAGREKAAINDPSVSTVGACLWDGLGA